MVLASRISAGSAHGMAAHLLGEARSLMWMCNGRPTPKQSEGLVVCVRSVAGCSRSSTPVSLQPTGQPGGVNEGSAPLVSRVLGLATGRNAVYRVQQARRWPILTIIFFLLKS